MERLLLRLRPIMTTKIVVGFVIVSLAVLSLAAFAGVISSDPVPAKPQQVASRSMAASRLFMLLPDGKVEITDSFARRVYRWDGRRWIEVEVIRLPAPDAEMR